LTRPCDDAQLPIRDDAATLRIRQVKALHEALDRLRAQVEELRASRRRLVLADDADRRRIERQLHDGPQQHLVSLATNLQLARRLVQDDPAGAAALLDEMRRGVREALDAARTLAHRIYPPLLDEGGLGVALRHAAASVGVATNVQVAPGLSCSPEIAGAVYFCCLETLERLSAHAEARATVIVREEDEALLFEIVGGVGADLGHLQDRVEALGGRLTIESEPGDGLRVCGSLPRSG
jgi:signal transduction histidine kinase